MSVHRFSFRGILSTALLVSQPTIAATSFKEMTCFDVADPGASGSSDTMVSLVRKTRDPHDSRYRSFDVTVRKNTSLNPPDRYVIVGSYTAILRESPYTQSPYTLQFKAVGAAAFDLGVYSTNSLPWADFRMITNAGPHLKKELSMQLECSAIN